MEVNGYRQDTAKILFFKNLPLLDLHSIHLLAACFLQNIFAFYLFVFFLFIIQLTKQKRPLTLACSILSVLFVFLIQLQNKKGL